jgi:hypothetical protein
VYDPSLRATLLRILSRWGKLPESDLLARLTPLQVVGFRPEVFRDLVADGLIRERSAGDERVIEITELGRRAVEGPG